MSFCSYSCLFCSFLACVLTLFLQNSQYRNKKATKYHIGRFILGVRLEILGLSQLSFSGKPDTPSDVVQERDCLASCAD